MPTKNQHQAALFSVHFGVRPTRVAEKDSGIFERRRIGKGNRRRRCPLKDSLRELLPSDDRTLAFRAQWRDVRSGALPYIIHVIVARPTVRTNAYRHMRHAENIEHPPKQARSFTRGPCASNHTERLGMIGAAARSFAVRRASSIPTALARFSISIRLHADLEKLRTSTGESSDTIRVSSSADGFLFTSSEREISSRFNGS